MKQKDLGVIKDFGKEWNYYTQADLSNDELQKIFNNYFSIFPWELINNESVGFDMGSGSGRWAKFIAPKVKHLHCIEPSISINISKQNLKEFKNCSFHNVKITDVELKEKSMDFGYSLGVIHHISEFENAIKKCLFLLKPNAPMLFYFYYAFDNKPIWYKALWLITNPIRLMISRLPFIIKLFLTTIIANLIYYPLTRISKLLSFFNINTKNVPLSYYKDMSLYTMRTDALDRFGTKLELRFNKKEIKNILELNGLKKIKFSNAAPFWCVVGQKEDS